jgi:hypothetical protein
VSQRFPAVNFADADVTFKSSDGVLFHVHRKNLEVCTEGFPPAEISVTAGEVSDLLETAETLDLLFQFMYPKRHPALDTTPFEILHPLAEAAEKYQVFPAMNICHIRLRCVSLIMGLGVLVSLTSPAQGYGTRTPCRGCSICGEARLPVSGLSGCSDDAQHATG